MFCQQLHWPCGRTPFTAFLLTYGNLWSFAEQVIRGHHLPKFVFLYQPHSISLQLATKHITVQESQLTCVRSEAAPRSHCLTIPSSPADKKRAPFGVTDNPRTNPRCPTARHTQVRRDRSHSRISPSQAPTAPFDTGRHYIYRNILLGATSKKLSCFTIRAGALMAHLTKTVLGFSCWWRSRRRRPRVRPTPPRTASQTSCPASPPSKLACTLAP